MQDVMDFFRMSAGQWRSQRTTHHLPFRRTELGELEIQAAVLEPGDEKLVEICTMHEIDPSLAIGGAAVQWHGSMEWDKEDESHEGNTGFAIVPDADNPKQGRMLRERGYAEIVPVVGRYIVDDADGMILITEYETMSSIERFWFANPNLRFRTSTVKRFGGLNTASFCAETRLDAAPTSQPLDTAALPLPSVWGW